MKNLQIQICLLIWFEAVESFKFVQVELGKNITVNCDLADVTSGTEIYWYIQTQDSAPVVILRTLSAGTEIDANYYNTILKQKFTLVNYSLLIQNITEDELGDYYCVKTGEPFFPNGTRLHTRRHDSAHINKTPWRILTVVSALLNCVFIAAIIALLASRYKRSSKGRQQPPDSNLQQYQDMTSAQYDEIELPARGAKLFQVNDTYALVQFPKP
ncbi:uncharacterized protein LOC118801524 [Colossoma macropomum]|uniref:uncharacterized protein LOC118801524 n=1 Tax=Colossoma macropomum TaxID=42526 RepID=UPI001863CBAC|nr:uncharacterized protein LOC118801524 [Colossoma macropomum]